VGDGSPIGWVSVTLGMEGLQTEIRHILIDTLKASLIAIAGAGLVLGIALRGATASLRRASAFAAGLWRYRGTTLPAEGKIREMSALSRSLNRASTALARQHADLSKQQRRLDTTLALSPDGFVFVDETGQVAYLNAEAERMLGLAPGEALGWAWPDFRCWIAKQCPDANACQATDRRCDIGLGCRNLTIRAPEHRVLSVSSAGFASDPGQGVLCLRDVTRETEVDRMKSEFLSTAAHELRSPMASILGFVDLLLKRDYEADKRRELLGIVHQQAEALTKMLNELLDLARIEARAGKDFKLAEHDLCELVRQAAGALLVPGDARRVELKLPDGPVRVRADAEKFRQALTNVLSNAYKFSPLGGAIELEVLREEGGGAVWAGVRVTDHGMGMTAEEASRAGERFYRADRTGHIPGTGLGLALVKEILQIHGGTVDIDSTPGEGTRVTVWLCEA
jgi:signal transduction histidine kinase